VVPLFPELRIELERLFESDSSEGAEYVITRYRDPERTNLGTQFGRIVQLAGIEPIKKPFNNMRASRSTEIYNEFGAFLESQWIGHSAKVAKDHYLQVREEDFEKASQQKPEIFHHLENAVPANGPVNNGVSDKISSTFFFHLSGLVRACQALTAPRGQTAFRP
jgi:hypothetical protein